MLLLFRFFFLLGGVGGHTNRIFLSHSRARAFDETGEFTALLHMWTACSSSPARQAVDFAVLIGPADITKLPPDESAPTH
jgi:hypothetical protein